MLRTSLSFCNAVFYRTLWSLMGIMRYEGSADEAPFLLQNLWCRTFGFHDFHIVWCLPNLAKNLR